MTLRRKLLIALIAVSAHQTANAYVQNSNVTIDEIVHWESTNPIYFKMSNGAWCYLMPDEKNLYALVLSMQAQRTQATIHCHDQVDTNGGLSARKLHRIWTLP